MGELFLKGKVLLMMKKYILLILLCLFYTLSSNPSYASMPKGNIQLGIDVLVNDYPELLKGKQVGLITNQSGVNGKLVIMHYGKL